VLRFNTKEECSGEAVHGMHAGTVRALTLGFEVTVGRSHREPQQCKAQPREQKVHGENKQRPAPLRVNEGGEDVLQVTPPPLGHIRLRHVAIAALEDNASPKTATAEAGQSSAKKKNTENS